MPYLPSLASFPSWLLSEGRTPQHSRLIRAAQILYWVTSPMSSLVEVVKQIDGLHARLQNLLRARAVLRLHLTSRVQAHACRTLAVNLTWHGQTVFI